MGNNAVVCTSFYSLLLPCTVTQMSKVWGEVWRQQVCLTLHTLHVYVPNKEPVIVVCWCTFFFIVLFMYQVFSFLASIVLHWSCRGSTMVYSGKLLFHLVSGRDFTHWQLCLLFLCLVLYSCHVVLRFFKHCHKRKVG